MHSCHVSKHTNIFHCRTVTFYCSLCVQSFQMLRELSASITGQSRPPGSLGQLVGGIPNSIAIPTNGEPDDEEEVVFETKTEGLGGGKKYNITVNLTEGKLTFKKQGVM